MFSCKKNKNSNAEIKVDISEDLWMTKTFTLIGKNIQMEGEIKYNSLNQYQ